MLHQDLKVIQRCRELISEWLNDISLELKPSKTRITHTLDNECSEDGQAGFDFLGYNIRQFPAGKYKSAKNGCNQLLGFNTFITPSKDSCKRHLEKIKCIIRKHKHSSQFSLINELNPIIRGWCNYYQFSDAVSTKEYSRQDHLVYIKLRAWGLYKCRKLKKVYDKYYRKIGNRKWVFATKNGELHARLLSHGEFSSIELTH